MMEESEVQPKKHCFPILVTEDGIITDARDEQPSKQ